MTIYFDKRALEQQKKEDEEIKQEELDKKAEQEKNKEAAESLSKLFGFFIQPAIVMLLWNWLMPSLFGLVTIGYWTAMGLYLMSRILFGKYE